MLIASLCTFALLSRRANIADKVLFGITALGWWGLTYIQATTSVQTNIRIDLVLFGPILLGLAIAALVKWVSLGSATLVEINKSNAIDKKINNEERQNESEGQKKLNAGNTWAIVIAIIVGIPLLFVVWMMTDIKSIDTKINAGKSFLFDAAFRDEATQAAFFGDIKPADDTWAGFYEFDTQDDRFKYVVINRAGRSWIYNRDKWILRKFSSEGALKNTSVFQTQEVKEHFIGNDQSLSLRILGDNKFEFEFGPTAYEKTAKKIPAQLIEPPRFPVKAVASDKVIFLGAFAGKFAEKEKTFSAVELWLWHDGDRIWGRYLIDNFSHGEEYDSRFRKGYRMFEASCNTANCLNQDGIEIKIEDYVRVKLEKLASNQLLITHSQGIEPVKLSLGVLIPDSLYELAPLTNRSENKYWLDAVSIGYDKIWKVP
jgi:hypothetical protein